MPGTRRPYAAMYTVFTQQGRRIEIISQSELCDPVNLGEHVRAYCHIHGSDHQRSLSINKATGWGHCFNATCNATVLVAEWRPDVAERLLHMRTYYTDSDGAPSASYALPQRSRPHFYQPMLLPPVNPPPKWQQEERGALLMVDELMQAALGGITHAKLYLEERGIPLEVAQQAGVCYLPTTALSVPALQKQAATMRRWTERIIFPLVSPTGQGYIGRSLWHWQPGMDENTHKALLDEPHRPKRWIKTNPAGWFGCAAEELSTCIVMVEGTFDRLTLLAAGLHPAQVIALAGTAVQIESLPSHVKGILLAFDGDAGGQDASCRLANELAYAGFEVRVCLPREDRWGKDWNERWRRLGAKSVEPVFEAYRKLQASLKIEEIVAAQSSYGSIR